jgi:hypothetical protein
MEEAIFLYSWAQPWAIAVGQALILEEPPWGSLPST